jgi:hypothetical protein
MPASNRNQAVHDMPVPTRVHSLAPLHVVAGTSEVAAGSMPLLSPKLNHPDELSPEMRITSIPDPLTGRVMPPLLSQPLTPQVRSPADHTMWANPALPTPPPPLIVPYPGPEIARSSRGFQTRASPSPYAPLPVAHLWTAPLQSRALPTLTPADAPQGPEIQHLSSPETPSQVGFRTPAGASQYLLL